MSVPHPPSVASSRGVIAAASLAAAVVACLTAADPTPKAEKPKETLFANWPNQTPDAVIVFTGQTWGFLQPCGCSRPQTGGLERRAVFIDQLKKKGWPVAAVDLGDVYPEIQADRPSLAEQRLMKYAAAMNAMREMGYLGVGIGKTELQGDLIAILGSYSYQKEQRPVVLSANAVGMAEGKTIPRVKHFRGFDEGSRPVVEEIEVGKVGEVAIGVTGVASGALRDENKKNGWAKDITFTDGKKAITDALAALGKHKLKPQINVLIFQGSSADAVKVAADFPQFQVILCQAVDNAPPPLQPPVVQGKKGEKTLILEVGQKGQHVGVLGAFKTPSGFDFKYQLVLLGEEFITPGTEAEALESNKTLQILESYSKAVKDAKLLSDFPRVLHPAQIHAATDLKPPVNLTYVGSEACKACHAAEFKKWTDTHHSHAMDTLAKVAKRPSLREFDGECVRCHTVGFDYKTGAYDPKNNAAQNKLLHHVGCESCHGPGSGHVAAPKRQDLLALMSEWKQPGAAKLPGNDFMDKMAKLATIDRGKEKIDPAQHLLINRVSQTCTKCHDQDSDPHFDLYKNWPKISHTGLAPAGGWPSVAPNPAEPPKK